MSPSPPRSEIEACDTLVFGLSGAVGRALLLQRGEAASKWLAISRRPPATDNAGVLWCEGRLPDAVPAAAAMPGLRAIVSLGPLDAFAAAFAAQDWRPQRVIALGSTSVESKRHSPDPQERELAERLARAEAMLTQSCRQRGIALLILRPTLIYGMGGDRSLSPLVRLAQRWRWLPISRRARGLRMPVHAGDLAMVVAHALARTPPAQGVYALPGGEALAFDVMLERTLAAAAPRARLLRVPAPLFVAACWGAGKLGLISGTTAGMLSRLDQDLLADASTAIRDLGYAPRSFRPTRDMFAVTEGSAGEH